VQETWLVLFFFLLKIYLGKFLNNFIHVGYIYLNEAVYEHQVTLHSKLSLVYFS